MTWETSPLTMIVKTHTLRITTVIIILLLTVVDRYEREIKNRKSNFQQV